MEPKLLTWSQRGRLWLRLGIRLVLAVAVVLLVIFAVVPLLYLMMPFVLALLLAWVLNPMVRWVKNRVNVSRGVISLVVLVLGFAAVGGLCYGLLWALVGQIRSLTENWSAIAESSAATLDAVEVFLRQVGDSLPDSVVQTGDDLLSMLSGWVRGLDFSGQVSDLAGYATGLVGRIPGFLVAAVVFLMASYFITSDYPRLRFAVTEQVPVRVRNFCAQFKRIFMEAFGGYIKSQLLLSFGVFLILAVGFSLTGESYGLLLAFALAVMDFIPIIGAGTVMVPWAAVDLITGNYRETIALMVIWGVIVLFRRMAEPKILGNQTGLSPILSLVGIYVGMELGGVLGMVVGPMVLLMVINLSKLGIFRPVAADVRMAAADLSALLKEGQEESSE